MDHTSPEVQAQPQPAGWLAPWRERFDRLRNDLDTALLLPDVEIDLMLGATAGNHPFYRDLVEKFHADSQRFHPKLPALRRFEWGVALQRVPARGGDFLLQVESSARRNVRKATRDGFSFQAIDPNHHLDGIRAVRRSTQVRQGPVPASLVAEPEPNRDPPSTDPRHGYLWYGVLGAGQLAAYASCFVAGELAIINHILGHAERQPHGVVPLLIAGMVDHLLQHHPSVRWLAYGSYFGAQPTMRRFKRKMGFRPVRVIWRLDASKGPVAASAAEGWASGGERLESIRVAGPFRPRSLDGATFCYLEGARSLAYHGPALSRALPARRLLELARSVAEGSSHHVVVLAGGAAVAECAIEPARVGGRRLAAVIRSVESRQAREGAAGEVAEFALARTLQALHERGMDLVHFDPASPAGEALRRIGYSVQ